MTRAAGLRRPVYTACRMPRIVEIRNLNRPELPPLHATYCDTFLCRLRGLMFRRSLDVDEGLLLVQGRESRLDAAIHMLAVGMELTVVWLDNSGNVVDKVLAQPWRPFYLPHSPARYILECHPRRWEHFHIGEQIHIGHD
ncbi:MAG: hypothetical protein D6770_00115 [Anaerolineae bacterium]|nr:MAG: hypothetical protein D6770_00115 [Anaerolineae bacterium]